MLSVDLRTAITTRAAESLLIKFVLKSLTENLVKFREN